ncbi:MAG: hypothetical protein GY772_02705 [bacterium]|nr:hypothetical protein [bacterium]
MPLTALRDLTIVVVFLCTAARPADVAAMRLPPEKPTWGNIWGDMMLSATDTKTQVRREAFTYLIPFLPKDPVNPALWVHTYVCRSYSSERVHLFAFTKDPRRSLSSDRISSCAASLVREATRDKAAQAKFFRSTVASAAHDLGAHRDTVLDLGKWADWATFARHYRTAGRHKGRPVSAFPDDAPVRAAIRAILSISDATGPATISEGYSAEGQGAE